jgi:hypothetical protein
MLKSFNVLRQISFRSNLVGPLVVDRSTISNMEDLERAFSVKHGGWVKQGGAWKPKDCKALKKVSLISIIHWAVPTIRNFVAMLK